jgi:hypothetical protein
MSDHLTIEQIAENYRNQLVETARRCVALRRRFPGCVVRWKRAAVRGPNQDQAVVIVFEPGAQPQVLDCPYSRIEELASKVTDAEAYAEIERRAIKEEVE